MGCARLSAPVAPAEMKEWMQSRQVILDRVQQCRDKENDLRVLQERVSTAAADINARLVEVGSQAAGAKQATRSSNQSR